MQCYVPCSFKERAIIRISEMNQSMHLVCRRKSNHHRWFKVASQKSCFWFFKRKSSHCGRIRVPQKKRLFPLVKRKGNHYRWCKVASATKCLLFIQRKSDHHRWFQIVSRTVTSGSTREKAITTDSSKYYMETLGFVG